MASRVLSIIVPVRNAADMIGPLVGRLRALAPPPGWETELLVGYNHSTDGTLDVLRALSVRVVPCDRLSGPANRNTAVREARGDLLYFNDHDAWPARDDFLVRLVEIARHLGPFGALGGPILPHPAQRWNPVALGDHYACWFNWLAPRASGWTTLFHPTCSIAMPRDAFERVGGFDERIAHLHDFDIQERLRALGLGLYFSRDLPVFHHDRATPWASWRHSWAWGESFRFEYIRRVEPAAWPFLDRPRLFWLNLPRLLHRRLGRVVRRAWTASRRDTLYCFPFLVATVCVWALAVGLREQSLIEPPAAPVR